MHTKRGSLPAYSSAIRADRPSPWQATNTKTFVQTAEEYGEARLIKVVQYGQPRRSLPMPIEPVTAQNQREYEGIFADFTTIVGRECFAESCDNWLMFEIRQMVTQETSLCCFITEAVSWPEYGLFSSYEEAHDAAEALGEGYLAFPL